MGVGVGSVRERKRESDDREGGESEGVVSHVHPCMPMPMVCRAWWGAWVNRVASTSQSGSSCGRLAFSRWGIPRGIPPLHPFPASTFDRPQYSNACFPVCKCIVTIISTRPPGIRGQHPLHSDNGASDGADGRERRGNLDPPPRLGPGLRRLLRRQRNLDWSFCQHCHGLQGPFSLPNSASSRYQCSLVL